MWLADYPRILVRSSLLLPRTPMFLSPWVSQFRTTTFVLTSKTQIKEIKTERPT